MHVLIGFTLLDIFSTEEKGGFGRNLAYAIVAQGIGLLTSVLTSLVLPKFLGVDDYAYWQLFLLYSSYSGFALLGLNDGIYLRLGGKTYSELDYGELKAQQIIVIASQTLVALGCLCAIDLGSFEPYRAVVLCLCVLMGLLTNLTQCLRYVFQCTNLTRISSLADLIAKGLFIFCIAVALLLGIDYSMPFILGYIICQGVALAYVLICARNILHASANFRGVLSLCASDIVAGLKIMAAYYADSLIVGFTRMMTDWHLGLAAFGKLSLSFSLTNFVLTFIGQVSMVAFPVLKRLDADGQREKYLTLRLLLHTVLPFVYLLYIPVKIILGLWLPEYEDSLYYLALTLPLCVYNCKASLLFNNYLKMGRREGVLCSINLATMALNIFFANVSIVSFASVEMATCGIVCSVALRDFVFELFMARKFGNGITRVCASEALLTVGFMAASWCLGAGSWFVVAAILVIYTLFNRDGAKLAIAEVGKRLIR